VSTRPRPTAKITRTFADVALRDRAMTASGSARTDRTRVRFVIATAVLVPLLALEVPPLGNLIYRALVDAAYGFLYLVAR
jgi:hypothetical protein